MTRIWHLLDQIRFALAARRRDTPNGCTKLQAWHQAVLDADDSLHAVGSAIADNDPDEALRLILLARESIAGHLEELKGLL